MLFNSYIFIFAFLPITLLGFFILSIKPEREHFSKAWLVLSSLFFYGWWNPKYLILITGSIIFNYAVGAVVRRQELPRLKRKLILFTGITANLALLAYYKYANFFIDISNQTFGTQWHLDKLLLPLGISFFTFTQIIYLIDLYKDHPCSGNFADYTLFVTFFPHLIAGPVIHHSELMPQFANRKTYQFRWDDMAVGLTLFAFGLFKKVIIADGLSEHASKIFSIVTTGYVPSTSDAWCGALSYSLQIYFDFSGYSEMALGLARMFGVIMPWNFNSPYKAVDLVDFWRRWHITLSRALRDYIYIPMGGNRCGVMRRYTNLLVTMLLGGLWHGAGWTYLMWGGLHGVGLAVNHLISQRTRFLNLAGPTSPVSIYIRRSCTFLFVLVGWVYFRASDLNSAHAILGSMLGLGQNVAAVAPNLLKPKLWGIILFLIAWVMFAPNVIEVMRDSKPALLIYAKDANLDRQRILWLPNVKWSLLVALLFVLSILSLTRAGEFLYYNF